MIEADSDMELGLPPTAYMTHLSAFHASLRMDLSDSTLGTIQCSSSYLYGSIYDLKKCVLRAY